MPSNKNFSNHSSYDNLYCEKGTLNYFTQIQNQKIATIKDILKAKLKVEKGRHRNSTPDTCKSEKPDSIHYNNLALI